MSVVGAEVLQDLLVITLVDVIAVDFQNNLTRLKTGPGRLPACSEWVKTVVNVEDNHIY